jgi:thiamine pyrophosphate-dependent acetolactate synthase large subunit-like protein
MMPMDMQAHPVPEDAQPLPARVPPPDAVLPAPAAVAVVADLVTRARRPVVLPGRGAVRSGAREVLERLGARIGALDATTAVAKGFFAGLSYDVDICGGFATPLARELLHDAVVVHVDTDPTAINSHRPVAAAIIGDARETAIALERELERRGHQATGFRHPETAHRLGERRAWRNEPFEEPTRGQGMDPGGSPSRWTACSRRIARS